MLLFVLLVTVNGLVTIIDKVINLEAKKSLGTINGTLINHLEATVISLVIALLLGDSRLADLSHQSAVPLVDLLDGVFGLVAVVLTVIAVERVRVPYSTIILLADQLGTGLILDATAAGKVVLLKLLGLLIVIAGVFPNQMITGRSTETYLREQE